jgi:hypothetical protein
MNAVLEEIDETLVALIELPSTERGKRLKVREVDAVGPWEPRERGSIYYTSYKHSKVIFPANLQSSLERSRAARRLDPPLKFPLGRGTSGERYGLPQRCSRRQCAGVAP